MLSDSYLFFHAHHIKKGGGCPSLTIIRSIRLWAPLTTRGLIMAKSKSGLSQSQLNHHSNQLNSNNPAHKARMNNHAHQLNPNNPAYNAGDEGQLGGDSSPLASMQADQSKTIKD